VDPVSTEAQANCFFSAIDKELSLPIRAVPDMDETEPTVHHPTDLAYL